METARKNVAAWPQVRLGYANRPKGGYRSAQMPHSKRPLAEKAALRLVFGAIAAMPLFATVPTAAQRAPVADQGIAARIPPVTQPPGATIMAEPVALFIAATDADGDAKVTRAELRSGVERSFAAVETTSPGSIGYIGLSEWAERWLGDRNALPSAYETDTDGDNRITLAELTAQLDFTFTRLDRDRDGKLIRSELLTLDSARNAANGGYRNGRRERAPR